MSVLDLEMNQTLKFNDASFLFKFFYILPVAKILLVDVAKILLVKLM